MLPGLALCRPNRLVVDGDAVVILFCLAGFEKMQQHDSPLLACGMTTGFQNGGRW